jgi:hypothetical protein
VTIRDNTPKVQVLCDFFKRVVSLHRWCVTVCLLVGIEVAVLMMVGFVIQQELIVVHSICLHTVQRLHCNFCIVV